MRRRIIEKAGETVNLTLSSYSTSIDAYGGSGSFNVYNNGVALGTNDYIVSVRSDFLSSLGHSGSTVSFTKSGSSHQTSTKYCYIDVTYKGATKTHTVSQAADSLSSSHSYSVESITNAFWDATLSDWGSGNYYANVNTYMTGTFKIYNCQMWKDDTVYGTPTYSNTYSGQINSTGRGFTVRKQSNGKYWMGVTFDVTGSKGWINGTYCYMLSSAEPYYSWSNTSTKNFADGTNTFTSQTFKKKLSTNNGMSVGSETSSTGTGTVVLDIANLKFTVTW